MDFDFKLRQLEIVALNLTRQRTHHNEIGIGITMDSNMDSDYINPSDPITDYSSGVETGSNDDMDVSPILITNCFFGVVFACGVVANVFVIALIMCLVKDKITVTNVYILNLAISDLMFILWIPFVITRSIIGEWIWGNALCKLYFIFTTVNQFGSIAFLTALSVDRYMAVCHPVKARTYRTVPNALAAVVACWMIIVLLLLPVYKYSTVVKLVGAPHGADMTPQSNDSVIYLDRNQTGSTYMEPPQPSETLNASTAPDNGLIVPLIPGDNPHIASTEPPDLFAPDEEHQCMIYWPTEDGGFNRGAFTLYAGVSGYMIPLLIIWALYSRVLLTLRRRRKIGNAKKPAYRKATVMVLAVVLSYTLCWTPFWFLQFAFELLDDETKQLRSLQVLSLAAYCLQSANSALNPLLYCLVSGAYGKAFWKKLSVSIKQRRNRRSLLRRTIPATLVAEMFVSPKLAAEAEKQKLEVPQGFVVEDVFTSAADVLL